MVTTAINSKNNNFKNGNVMEAKILKLTEAQLNRLAFKSAAIVFLSVVLLLLNLLNANAANYYWVGGTGNWNDVLHWATTSGGNTFHVAPPDATSDVYFDVNSFSSNNDTVDLTGGPVNLYARSFTLSTINNPFFKSLGDSIQLYGKMDISGTADFDSVSVPFIFSGSPLDNTIRTGGNSVFVIIKNTTVEWNLLDALNGNLRVYGATFNTNNHPLNLAMGFGLWFSDNGHINLGTSECHLRNFVLMSGSTADADSSFIYCGESPNINNGAIYGSNIKFNYVEAGYVSGDSCSFKNLSAYKVTSVADTIENLTILHNYPPTFTQVPGITCSGVNSTYIKKAVINVSPFFWNNVLLRGKITFDTLLLSNPDDNLEIYPGDTIKITSLFANNATVSNKINVNPCCGGSGTAYLDFGSLNVCTDNLVLQNITALGVGIHNASTGCIDSGGNSGWAFAPCSPSAPGYYWVGGSGNWSDVSHWATTSGGTTFHIVLPGINDDVYFDGNSFASNSDTVKVIGAFAACNSFNWDVPQLAPVIIGSSIPLTIAGDLNLQSIFDWRVSDLRLTSSNGTILTNGNQLLSVTIDNNSTYQLADDIKCGYLDLLNTNFNSNNRTLTVGNIDCRQSPIEFGTSIINIVNDTNSFGLWSKIGDSTNVSNATINLYKNGGWLNFNNTKMNAIKEINVFANSSGVNSLITGPFNCGKLIADQIVSITPQLFMGNRSFINKVVFKNNVYLNTGIIIDTLLLDNPGYTTQLTSGDTLFINNAFLSSYSSGLFGHITSTLPTHISMNNGIVCLNNISLQNIHTIGGAQFFAGNGCVDLGGNTGWQFAPCSIVSDVWPGDANYDLTVNNNDVLNIGLAYGNTGPLRTGASLAYVAQPATDWNGYFANAVNHKHADTNGDGVVDNNDTTAITLNYGLTHPARLASNTQQTFTGPQLYLQANIDTVAEGDTVEFDIYLGNVATPVSNIYGLAFTINIDTTFVDTVYSNFDFTGCWMGTEGVDLLTYNHPLWSQNKIDVALTRTTQTDTSGYGYLGRVGVVVVDNVGARITLPGYMTMPVSISNVYAINYAENILSITSLGDSVVIDTTGTVGVNNAINLNSTVSVYPNPAKDKINIKSSKVIIESAELINTMGITVMEARAEASAIALNIQNINSGIYVLRIKTDKGVVNKKVKVLNQVR